jgi:aqualysin 1
LNNLINLTQDVIYALDSFSSSDEHYQHLQGSDADFREQDEDEQVDGGQEHDEENSYISHEDIGREGDSSYVPWNLDRIDQQHLPLDGIYKLPISSNVNISGHNKTSPVSIYVLDSGINNQHTEIQYLNISCIFNAYTNVKNGNSRDNTCEDDNGHGTHVAGIMAGKSAGVIRGINNGSYIRFHSVKVVKRDGTASLSAVLAGLDFVAGVKYDEEKQFQYTGRDESTIIYIGFGGPPRDSFYQSILKLKKYNVLVVASAGNGNGSSTCGTHFPAGYSESYVGVVAVGSMSNTNDTVSTFSNIGECISIFAPGEFIASAGINVSTTIEGGSYAPSALSGMATMSGTSEAAAHVTAAVALYVEKHSAEAQGTTLDIYDKVIRALEISSTHHTLQGIDTDTTDSLLNIKKLLQ